MSEKAKRYAGHLRFRCHNCNGYGHCPSESVAKSRGWVKVGAYWYCPRPECQKAKPPQQTRPAGDYFLMMSQVRDAHSGQFLKVFGKSMKPFWRNDTGLDVVKLDAEVVKSNERRSFYQVAAHRFGPVSVRLVKAILADERAAAEGSYLVPGNVVTVTR